MASIKNLKKDIHNVLGDILTACYDWELSNPGKATKALQGITEEVITTFDALVEAINLKDVENKAQHFKNVRIHLEEKASDLVAKINSL